MPYIKKILAAEETKELRMKKELAYLQLQFPWKTMNEISTVFSEKGELNQEALKKLKSSMITNEYIEE